MFAVGLLHNHDDYDSYILFKHKNNETRYCTSTVHTLYHYTMLTWVYYSLLSRFNLITPRLIYHYKNKRKCKPLLDKFTAFDKYYKMLLLYQLNIVMLQNNVHNIYESLLQKLF